MPEKIRTSPASLPVIHRKDQAALVLEDDELPDEESFEVDEDFEDSDDEDDADDELLEPDEDDDSDFAGTEPLPDERLSVR
jgi:hypothetical protein